MDEQAARQTAEQLARPTGEGGVQITTSMNESNAFITARALEALALTAGEALLEIGPGNGRLSLQAITDLGEHGSYLGFEYSEDIAALASQTLADCGARVDVRSGDFMTYEPEPQTFDALLGVNVVYFFEDLNTLAARCREWLRPGGRVAIGTRSLPSLSALPFTEHGFQLRPLDDLLQALHRAGFESVQARYFDEGTTKLGAATIAVDSIVVSAIRT